MIHLKNAIKTKSDLTYNNCLIRQRTQNKLIGKQEVTREIKGTVCDDMVRVQATSAHKPRPELQFI